MKPISAMSLGELAAFVCSHLGERGIKAVLSGGGCVSIYTDNRYVSYDLDFVEAVPTNRKCIKEVLADIGFVEKGRYYEHPETEFYVDILVGPLAVGSEPVQNIEELKFSTGQLTLLSATDCVKDRLAAYYHWNDLQCLEQALLVVQNRNVDLREIQRWSVKENKSPEFNAIRDKFHDAAQIRDDS